PRVVRYVDTFQETRLSTVLIMEYFGADTLWHQHQECELRRDEVLVLQQSLNALVYLHEADVTHQDLKPLNILLRSRNPIDVALADFGWARESAESMSTVYAGTVHYRAPEVLAHARYRSLVDIWSLGVVGLEHLQELPNEEHSSTEADYALSISVYAEFLAIYDPSHTHRRLLSQMLREKPAERLTAVECLKAVSDLIA
ncbi:kinase-like domain-containing protein, partial [Dichotomopilus funicola]